MSTVKGAENIQNKAAITYAIDIVNVTKSFVRKRADRGAYTTVKSAFVSLFRRDAKAVRRVSVLKDLTLRIPKGSSVGLIGRNGSGKSTFLKLLTGIYHPDGGSIAVRGRVAALIELGAGFHPDFSGRENLYLGGILLGLSRAEIESRFDQIVDFAELRDVIDNPVRTYSSGMFMRLGFSLAVHTDPDVLLIDEVLAVGDASFVVRCKERLSELKKAGKTLVLVSHDLDAVERWSDEVLWLHGGEVRDRGEPRRVIDHYRSFIERGEEDEIRRQEENVQKSVETEVGRAENSEPQRWGSREIEVLGAEVKCRDGSVQHVFHPDDSLSVELRYRMNQQVRDIVFGIAIVRADGAIVHGTNTQIERVSLPELRLEGVVRYSIDRNSLTDGSYSVDVAVHREDGYPYDYHRSATRFVVRSPTAQVGYVSPAHTWSFE